MRLTFTLPIFASLFGTVLSVTHAATEAGVSDSATTPAAPGFSYLGCIAEGGTSSELRRALTGASFIQSNMTPLICQSHCSAFRYAGLEYGTQCYCGNSFDNGATGNTISESKCSFQCSGDPSQKCGGDATLSLYGKPAPAPPTTGFSYLGCIAEGGTSATLRALTGASFSQPNMTPLVCQSLCSGYRYAGVEYGTQCFCGNSFDNGATGSAIPESSCPFQCGGDPNQKCGGDWTLSLYGKPAPPPPPPTCADNSQAVPFLRAFSPAHPDHFYTTSASELDNAVKNLGYTSEGSVGRIWTTQQPGTVPLYRLYSNSGTDHFYTTSAPERDNAVANLGYASESIAGFVYPAAMCGAVPLYRLYSPSATDHFYTPSASERDNAANRLGYSNEGVAGYILG